MGTVMSYAPFLGQEVPSFGISDGMETTTWWSDGPKPGSDGMAVIWGHTQIGGGFGVFNDIGRLSPGQEIEVSPMEKVAPTHFSVAKIVAGISKSDQSALNAVLENAPSGTGLALVTCGGEFDPQRSASEENIVVFAALQK